MHGGRGDDRKFDTKSSGGAAVNLILQVMLFMCCLPEYSSREEIAKGGRLNKRSVQTEIVIRVRWAEFE